MTWPHVELARLGLAGKALVMLVKMLSKMSGLVENDIVKSEGVKHKRRCWYSTAWTHFPHSTAASDSGTYTVEGSFDTVPRGLEAMLLLACLTSLLHSWLCCNVRTWCSSTLVASSNIASRNGLLREIPVARGLPMCLAEIAITFPLSLLSMRRGAVASFRLRTNGNARCSRVVARGVSRILIDGETMADQPILAPLPIFVD